LQLIDNQVKVFIPQRGKQPASMVDRKAFLEKYGFEPKRLVDFKALAGDASDAIPGVKGVGPKTTTNLIVKFGNLRGIYDNLDKIEDKIRVKLRQGKKRALLSYRLAKIVTDVPIKFDLSKCRLLDYDRRKVIQLFDELEFRSLIKRLPGMEKGEDKKKTRVKNTNSTDKSKDKQIGLFKL
ncbi:MAG TPA: 5'-3' exonuclease H3TH domain-containing protein, partial [Candidatus Bathyarchaeia archaeon]|nr:5'-3' exonuclease H3TH domain-containing protein [Candidatus Bathyarchaeia archaeon]